MSVTIIGLLTIILSNYFPSTDVTAFIQAGGTLVGLLISWYGRYRQGDITWYGIKK